MLERLKRLLPKPETIANNRWLRWLGPSLMHPRLWHMSRRGVATGAAIGVFFAFITPIAQIPLSAAVSVALRANIPTAIVATLVNTPPTFGPVYYAAWVVGSLVTGEKAKDGNKPSLLGGESAPIEAGKEELTGWRKWMVKIAQIGKPLLIGTVIFSVVFSALAYILVNGVWHWRVKTKRKRRLNTSQLKKSNQTLD